MFGWWKKPTPRVATITALLFAKFGNGEKSFNDRMSDFSKFREQIQLIALFTVEMECRLSGNEARRESQFEIPAPVAKFVDGRACLEVKVEIRGFSDDVISSAKYRASSILERIEERVKEFFEIDYYLIKEEHDGGVKTYKTPLHPAGV